MRQRSFGTLSLLAVALLLQSCSSSSSSSSSSHQIGWTYSSVNQSSVDRFDWQNQKSQLELVAKSTDSGVVVTKITPENFLGLRRGDVLSSVAGKPVRTVRELLGDMHALNGADAIVAVKRGGAEMTVKLSATDYRAVLPPPIAPGVTLESKISGASESASANAY